MSNPFQSWTEADVAAFNARSQKTVEIAAVARGNAPESDLHNRILAECRHRSWIAFHGSMAHRTFRSTGEPDFQILADRGRVFFIEAKTAKGKLSTSQQIIRHWAAKLGHTVHVVRSFEEFLQIIA